MAVLVVATTAGAQRVRQYDITIRRLNTAEQQLLHEQRTAIGLKKFEVDKQLKEVRKQRMEIQRLRSGVHSSQQPQHYSNQSATPRRTTQTYRPPEPDWKIVESPTVQVKGTFKRGGQMVAMVNGGQVVSSNDVFATTYRGETMYWRAREITEWGGDFKRVDFDGNPYSEDEPEPERKAKRNPAGIFTRIFGRR